MRATFKYVFIPLSFGIIFCYHPPFPSYYPTTYYVRSNIYGRQPASTLSIVNPLSLGQSYLQTPLLCSRYPGCNLFTPRNFVDGNSTIPKAEDLFTPAVVQYPAESKAQLEEYIKAMEEEVKEEAENFSSTQSAEFEKTDLDVKPVTYVNVKLGGDKNVNYQYSV